MLVRIRPVGFDAAADEDAQRIGLVRAKWQDEEDSEGKEDGS